MKLLGTLLLIVSLSVGAMTGALAYVVETGVADEDLVGKTVRYAEQNQAGETVIPAGAVLDEAMLQAARDANIANVHVKEFDFGLWPGRWIFMLSLVGLVGAALCLRAGAKQAIASGDERASEGPKAALQSIEVVLDGLLRDLPGMADDEARVDAIIDRLDDVQRTHLPAFAEARDRLIGAHGMGGFARIMDSFAGCERLINRAWSLAADDCVDEGIECLRIARTRLDETLALL